MTVPAQNAVPDRKKKLAVLVNTVAPYRLPVYAALAETFETLVLHGGREANRSWTLELPPGLRVQEVWTLQIPVNKQTGVGGVWDRQYVHVNGGLLWWLPRFRPDAILTNELGLRTLIALLYGALARVPVWVQWEGSLHSERHVGAKRHIRRLVTKTIRHWISYGAGSSEYLMSLDARPETVVEVQNAVPHQQFLRPAADGGRCFAGEPRPVLLSVGQLIPRKGLHTLIDACGRLAQAGMEFTLVLVGQGPEGERLREQAARVGLRNFRILPNQTQETLSEFYRAADVFVLPSLEDVWGLVVSEALWAGTPVLCSRYAGCAEVVAPENLFDPLDERSFDEALARVFSGDVRPAATDRLMTCGEMSRRICRSIAGALAGSGEERLEPAVQDPAQSLSAPVEELSVQDR